MEGNNDLGLGLEDLTNENSAQVEDTAAHSPAPDQGTADNPLAMDESAEALDTSAGNTEGNPEDGPAPEHAQIGDNMAPMDQEELRKEFHKNIRAFGRASGEGSSALPRLALAVVRAAADGLISTEKPRGGGKDDATIIYETYTAEDSKKAEHSAGGAKANASKLRQLIAMGCMTTCDPVDVADRTVRAWNEMVGAELKPKPLYAGLVDVARAQVENDKGLTDEAIKEALTKTPAEKSVEKEWTAIKKKIDGLVSGENSAGLKDQSPEAIKISEMVTEHVNRFETTAADESFIEMCMARGYTRAQAEEMAAGR